jgi:hypothetical protein
MATTIRRVVTDGARAVGGALETVAREALADLVDDGLLVSFGVWDDGGGTRFVCRVETPPGDPLSSEPPWRWWSPLFRSPEELRALLAAMVARRLMAREGAAAYHAASDAASAVAS